jgi:hypothetical protein
MQKSAFLVLHFSIKYDGGILVTLHHTVMYCQLILIPPIKISPLSLIAKLWDRECFALPLTS